MPRPAPQMPQEATPAMSPQEVARHQRDQLLASLIEQGVTAELGRCVADNISLRTQLQFAQQELAQARAKIVELEGQGG